jgi:prepilin-type processing-associated H-X9-DG protein
MYGSATTARSWHPGGVNVAFADGAVRFISESIDRPLWRSLGTRNGGEVTGE